MTWTEQLRSQSGIGGVPVPDRIIRESICTSDTLNQLSDFEERFWHRLIVNCDDYGRFDARPAILKSRLFPLRESLTFKNVSDCLAKLASVGLIELYEVDGRPFLYVVTWERYQRIRAKKSKFPAPGDNSSKNYIEIHTQENISTTYDSTCCQLPSNVPVIQSNAKCEMRNAFNAPAREDVAAVMTAYMDKISPTPSTSSIDELTGYVEQLGRDVCLRAIDAALDANARSWNYVKAILQDKQRNGVRSLADWDALEKKRCRKQEKNHQPWSYDPGDMEGSL